MTSLAIIDVGYGNTDSIRLAFARLGVEALLTDDPDLAEAAERLVLPGVGSAGYAMSRLRERGLEPMLRRRTRPTLGICLGMQIMTIEFARNVLGYKKANSVEFDTGTPEPVISLMEEQKNVVHKGGTMRLGAWKCALKPNTAF